MRLIDKLSGRGQVRAKRSTARGSSRRPSRAEARASAPSSAPPPSNRRSGAAPEATKPSLRSRLTQLLGRESTTFPAVDGPADAVLLGTVIALVAFGVVMVYSASAVFAHGRFDDSRLFLTRQSFFALLALPMMVVLARFDYHRLRQLTYPILVGATALLTATALGLGRRAGGASRWIQLGPINVQPAEIVKVALIFWLAYSLSKKADRIRSFTVGFLPHVLMAGTLALICLEQPDFGSAVMIALMTFVMLFTAGVRLGYMLGGVLLLAPAAYLLVTGSEYRMRRITAFLSPFEHRYTSGYQIAESLMSFGAGGVTGVGIGDSRQKLFFLPEAHTDFISAIVGEELGFVGFVAMVLAFLVLVQRGLRAAYRAADDYGTYLATGITMFIGFQAFTNLAVAVGLLPTKGLVLPFVSYGGSALLVNCAAIGVLLNVSRPRAPVPGTPKGSMRENRMRAAHAGGVA